jgi:hypothetical protein
VQVRAFLSTSSSDQIADFTTLYGVPSGLALEAPGGAVLARNFTSSLADGLLLSLINAGLIPSRSVYLSGSGTTGLVSDNCNGFTSDAAGSVASAGNPSATNGAWLSVTNVVCSGSFFVLCIAFQAFLLTSDAIATY